MPAPALEPFMHLPPRDDPASALALRSQYRQWENRAARLRLLVDTGQELTRLTLTAMRQRVLQRACAFLAMDHGLLLEWSSEAGPVQIGAIHGTSHQIDALAALLDRQAAMPQWQAQPTGQIPCALHLPLLNAEGKPFAALLLGNRVSLASPDSEDLQSLQLLATLLAAHLENSRLLSDLSARERTMSELVHRLFSAQEDERKRVAYDLHDGLAQTLAGLHQQLQGFASQCPALPDALQTQLATILQLAQRSVGEGRQVISGLRPNVLDDFGLLKAIDKEADRLRAAGHVVQWSERYAERLPDAVEITLFRIAQEGINNILKHAGPCSVRLALHVKDDQVWVMIEDHGMGFIASGISSDPIQGMGLTAMKERAHLVGGHFHCDSGSGTGTCLSASVPLHTYGRVGAA
jgi:signal transduction histidine kinase